MFSRKIRHVAIRWISIRFDAALPQTLIFFLQLDVVQPLIFQTIKSVCEKSKVYTIRLQSYKDSKILVCGKDLIPFYIRIVLILIMQLNAIKIET